MAASSPAADRSCIDAVSNARTPGPRLAGARPLQPQAPLACHEHCPDPEEQILEAEVEEERVQEGNQEIAQILISMANDLTPLTSNMWSIRESNVQLPQAFRVPASPEQIAQLPVEIAGDSLSRRSTTEPTCAICLSEQSAGDSLRRLPCGHRFHMHCCDQWLQNSKRCPLCLHAIDEKPEVIFEENLIADESASTVSPTSSAALVSTFSVDGDAVDDIAAAMASMTKDIRQAVERREQREQNKTKVGMMPAHRTGDTGFGGTYVTSGEVEGLVGAFQIVGALLGVS